MSDDGPGACDHGYDCQRERLVAERDALEARVTELHRRVESFDVDLADAYRRGYNDALIQTDQIAVVTNDEDE